MYFYIIPKLYTKIGYLTLCSNHPKNREKRKITYYKIINNKRSMNYYG